MPATLAKRAGTYDETTFDMPRIAQAKTVLWYPDRHNPDDCFTAIVTEVGDRSIGVLICLPELQFKSKNAVRHRNDPDGEMIDRSNDGVWDFCEDADNSKQLFVDIMKAVNTLKLRVEQLEKK